MDSMLKTMLECGIDQTEILVSAYRDEHGYHAETVLGATGALLGHAIQASAYAMAANGGAAVTEFERQTNPPFGKFVNCSDRISVFIQSELPFLLTVAKQLNWFSPEAAPDMQKVIAGIVEQVGGEWFPRLSVPSDHMPRDWSPDAVPRFRTDMRACLHRHKLPVNVCEVLCLALALGYQVADNKDKLDPEIGLRIGLEMAIATANIGNLNRPYVLEAHDEHDVISSAILRSEDMTAEAMIGASGADKRIEEPVEEIVLGAQVSTEGEAAEMLEDGGLPRISRLAAPRRAKPAFGKRQFG